MSYVNFHIDKDREKSMVIESEKTPVATFKMGSSMKELPKQLASGGSFLYNLACSGWLLSENQIQI